MKRGDRIEYDGRLFEVYRTIPEWQVGDKRESLLAVVKYWHCDRSFKKDGMYYIVRDIIEIEIEEIKT